MGIGSSGVVNCANTYLGTANYTVADGYVADRTVIVDGNGPAQLNLNFARDEVLDPRITFSRTSNATRVNAQGLIEYAPHNLLTYSENFDNAAWTKGNVTIAANTVVAPDGTTTGDILAGDGVSATHFISESLTFSAISYTYSAYLKKGTNNFAQFRFGSAAGGYYANFDLNSGVIGTTNATSSVVSMGNGWYRCSITATLAAATANIAIVLTTSASAVGGEANTLSTNIQICGAQLNIGSLQPYYTTSVKNLLGYSQNFENAAWTKSNSTIDATPVMGPLGFLGAEKLVEDTAASVGHYISPTNGLSLVAGQTVTYSVYAKAGERTFVQLIQTGIGPAGANLIAGFDLANGIAGTPNAGTSLIESKGNGWYRCSFTTPVSASATSTAQVRLALNSTASPSSYTGDGTSGIYIFGAQLSDSASLDPYSYNFGAAPTSTAYYGPRFDYDPVTLAPKGLLIEEARTNICQYSGDYTNWTFSEASTSGVFTTPTGSQSAIFLASTNALAHRIIKTGLAVSTSPANVTYCYGAFIYKPEGSDVGRLNFRLRSANGSGQNIALDVTGSATTTTFNFVASVPFGTTPPAAVTSSAITIQNYGNGVFRVSIASPASASTDNISQIDIGFGTNNDTSAGTINTKIGVWGLSVEAGSFPTSYIPTTSAQVTRTADNASMVGTNFNSWYNQSEGTIYSEWDVFGFPARPCSLVLDNGNRMSLSSTATFAALDGNVSSVYQGTGLGGSYATDTTYKHAGAYQLNNTAVAINGAASATDTTYLIPTVNQMLIGASLLASATSHNGHIQSIKFFSKRFLNTYLRSLTQ